MKRLACKGTGASALTGEREMNAFWEQEMITLQLHSATGEVM